MKKTLLLIFFIFPFLFFGQDIDFLAQFNGHYDYTAIGNTMNLNDNEDPSSPCKILTKTSAYLNLDSDQEVIAAYLYWAGSGISVDSVKLNGKDIIAEKNFIYQLPQNQQYFGNYKDVTNQVINTGNGTYTLSDFDLTDQIGQGYCQSGINFGGWAIIIVYEDKDLPLNQVTIFDGFEGVNNYHNEVNINLKNINVIDNKGAKIGFLAWEGDATLANNETLQINGDTLSNPPLNPSNNIFNSTNSFTNDDKFYNMDLDYFDIENSIARGDTSINIKMTSGDGITVSDIIVLNNIVTVFNSELPDPSPEINDITTFCNDRTITVDFTIHNDNATADLPAGNPIYFYADSVLIGTGQTQNKIPIDDEESQQISLTIPNNISNDFIIDIYVNQDINGNIAHLEIDEDNDIDSMAVHLPNPIIANPLKDIVMCDDNSNNGIGHFDFSENKNLAIGNQENVSVSFYTSEENAENNQNPTTDIANFKNTETPQVIYVRVTDVQNPDCYIIDSFLLDLYFMPTAYLIENFTMCDNYLNEGKTLIDLSETTAEALQEQPNSQVSYYTSQSNANNAENEIEDIENFETQSNPQEIFVRVENSLHPECFDTTSFTINITPINISKIPGLTNCNEGFYKSIFDLTEIEEEIDLNANEEIIDYYDTALDASYSTHAINNPSSFQNESDPQTIYIRVEDKTGEECYKIYEFSLHTKKCPPEIPEGFSPNNDGTNDTFYINGLYDIFEHFHIKIYSRYGNIVYEGDNTIEAWDGTANHGIINGNGECPTGAYYYVLNLHEPDYPIYRGWVYLER